MDRPDLAVPPGQRYIEVEHDYEYKFKDRLISIKQGESYLLLKKTNDNWWQVCKDDNNKPFYVPAQYVREVRRALMPPTKPLPNAGSGVGVRGGSGKDRPATLELKQTDENQNKRSPGLPPLPRQVALQPPKDDKGSPKSPRGQGQHTFPNTEQELQPQPGAESPIGPRIPLDLDMDSDREGDKKRNGQREKKRRGSDKDGQKRKDGEMLTRNGEKDRKAMGMWDKTIAPGESPKETLEKNRNDSESGDELSGSSTEQLQVLSSLIYS